MSGRIGPTRPTEMASPDDDVLLAKVCAEAVDDGSDDEQYWAAIGALRRLPNVVDVVAPLAASTDERIRAVVPDVLRYLGEGRVEHQARTLVLFRTLLRAPSVPVLAAIGYALDEMGVEERGSMMLPWRRHESVEVRRAVVAALLSSREPDAIAALIELSRDDDVDVRDWATFGLGTMLGPSDIAGAEPPVTTPELRAALVARLDDEDVDVRCEAIVGLAARRDGIVLPIVLAEIERGPDSPLVLEAARWLAAPVLFPGLRALDGSLDDDARAFWIRHGLHAAIEACREPR